mmetsp:Transcript_16449/g.17790  ORF Transcript_16449/g.17790 Transcript_16449/m.17790 type:complete len:635 (+) Transcript_16449:54-1958(+)|eukprot:gene1207-1280_t
MQRIADRIQREFSSGESYIEISALDGNGDAFRVYQGRPLDLTGHHFVHILRDPACFYFFNITCLPDFEQPEALIRRDLCWLTDPLSPILETTTATSLLINWNPVRFCGIGQTEMLNSVTYSIEIAEGVDWKETSLSRYMNDNISSTYRVAFRGKNAATALIENLKPARWYHVRLAIDYLGLRVMSESASFHTSRSPPSIPSTPRVTVVPVRNSFDTASNIPARLDILISWNASAENGFPIERYQVHLKRFDINGKIQVDEPPVLRKKHQMTQTNPQKNISVLIKSSKRSNQWIGSPGKSEVQIRNSIQSQRGRSPSPPRSPTDNPSASLLDPSSSSSLQHIYQGNKRPITWKIIYDNLNRSVKMFSPKDNDGEWWIRVRAKNAEGWSGFSSLCVINHFNYPSLFPNPMLKEAESQDEYFQFVYPVNNPNDVAYEERSKTYGSFDSTHSQQHQQQQRQVPTQQQTSAPNQKPNVSSIQTMNFSHDSHQSQQHIRFISGDKSTGSTPNNNEYLVITKSPSNKDQSSQSGSRHRNETQNSVQFKNHHYEHLDRLQDHKDEVGLFWDHKAVSGSDENMIIEQLIQPVRVKGTASHDEYVHLNQSGESFLSSAASVPSAFDMKKNSNSHVGLFPEINRK